MRTDKKNQLWQMFITLAIGSSALFLATLPLGNLSTSLKLSMVYIFFIYFPFLPLIHCMAKLGLLEKFLLANLSGLSYAAIYVLFDVVFSMRLTSLVYVGTTLIIIVINWSIWFKFSGKTVESV